MTGASAGSVYAGEPTGDDAAAVVTTPVPGGSGTWSGAIENCRPSSAGGGVGEIGVQAGTASGIWPRATGAALLTAPVGRGGTAATGGPRVTAGAGGF